jgi:hypothetical protein
MRRALAIIAGLFLLGCNTSYAQTSPVPGMGTTSPLGSTFSNAPSQPSGIPLGSNEISVGGLSPMISGTSCIGNTSGLATSGTATGMPMSGTGMGTTSTTFDGGGTSSSSAVSTCGTSSALSAAVTPITAGTTAVGSPTTAGVTTGSAARGVIPLGSTELGTPGESPTAAPPTLSVAPCGSTASAAGTMTTPGMSSPMGC